MLTKRLLFTLPLIIGALSVTPLSAQEVQGPVLLTISGAVENANRGAVDPDVDKFFDFSDAEFERAAQFDYASLQKLDWLKANADFPKGGDVQEYEGPLLADVLKAAGATGETITLTALDGYAIEVKMQDMVEQGAILALKRNGQHFSVGDFGPSQIVFPRAERADLKDMPDDNWIWSIYHIQVE
ncbi:MAG: molybdopterin-dependent oxidoreductase [Pseudomonadota bacterium]